MGFFDLPVSALSWADAQLATVLPDALRIAAWGILGAALSMALYRLVSPQRRLERIATEERILKGALRDDTTALADGLASARRLLQLAGLRLCLAVPAVVIAMLPVLFLMPWLDTRYAYEQVLSVGPEWGRTWLAPFFGALLATSLLIKFVFRIR